MRRFIAALGAAVLCLASTNAFAATITVTNTNDSGPGSLRYAIQGASPGDTINFAVPLPATIDLTTGELAIVSDVTLSGPGPDKLIVRRSTAPATAPFRVFDIVNNAHVTISGMTIANGFEAWGGGIAATGDLTLSNVVLTGNVATGSSGPALYNGGAGVALNGGTLTITDSTIDTNSCSGATLCVGGGVWAGAYAPVTLRITGSTISNNVASHAGGLFVGYAGLDADIRNSTISGNQVTGWGGAFIVYAASGTNTAKFTAVTISGPDASILSLMSEGTIPRAEFRDSILGSGSTYVFGNVDFVSNGFNIASGAPSFLTATGDRTGIDPMLAPLANYGGPTATHRLESGSPAIDAGSCASAANGAILADQRGVSRPQGQACDIGAFEVQSGGLENLDVAVSSRATQASVNNLQNSVSGLQNSVAQGLDTNVGSRASQRSVDDIQNGVNTVQNAVGSRASQVSVDAITGIVNGKLDAAISTRATQTSVDTVQNNLGSVQSGIGSVQSDIGTVQNGLGTVQTNLGTVQSGLGLVQTNLSALATQASVNQLGTGIGNVYTGLGTISTQVSGVGTQVSGLSTALDAAVSTRASQASLDALAAKVGGSLPQRQFIELQLLVGARLSSLYLPAAYGGNLETVRDLVASTITANAQAGINVNNAAALLASGNAALAAANYKLAYDTYSKAYQACIR